MMAYDNNNDKYYNFEEGLHKVKENLNKQSDLLAIRSKFYMDDDQWLIDLYKPFYNKMAYFSNELGIGLNILKMSKNNPKTIDSIIFNIASYLRGYKMTPLTLEYLHRLSCIYNMHIECVSKYGEKDPGLDTIKNDIISSYRNTKSIDYIFSKILVEQLLYLLDKKHTTGSISVRTKSAVGFYNVRRNGAKTSIKVLYTMAQAVGYYLKFVDYDRKIFKYHNYYNNTVQRIYKAITVKQSMVNELCNYNLEATNKWLFGGDDNTKRMAIKGKPVVVRKIIRKHKDAEIKTDQENKTIDNVILKAAQESVNTIQVKPNQEEQFDSDIKVILTINGVKLEVPAEINNDEISINLNLKVKI